eukprot:TRINITY_DN3888_c0_g1_i8.p1 TRINITY_DN3888_c0_g1~~TRINITY_DN3888_c0_g1_i8.p1  ORF type:complete len:319 (+),score=139.43 TRINITY_DN3888_c0_g1_i8:61-1017(+)
MYFSCRVITLFVLFASLFFFFFFLMIRRPPRSTLSSSSAASDVYKRQVSTQSTGKRGPSAMAFRHGWLALLAAIALMADAAPTMETVLGEGISEKVEADHADLERLEQAKKAAMVAVDAARKHLAQVKANQEALVAAAEKTSMEKEDAVDMAEAEETRLHDAAGIHIAETAQRERALQKRLQELMQQAIALTTEQSAEMAETEKREGERVAMEMRVDALNGVAKELKDVASKVAIEMSQAKAEEDRQLRVAASQASKATEEAATKAAATERAGRAAQDKLALEASQIKDESKKAREAAELEADAEICLLYTSPSPRDS